MWIVAKGWWQRYDWADRQEHCTSSLQWQPTCCHTRGHVMGARVRAYMGQKRRNAWWQREDTEVWECGKNEKEHDSFGLPSICMKGQRMQKLGERFSHAFFAVLPSKDVDNCWRLMTETWLGWQMRASYFVSATATHSLPCKRACDGHKGKSVDGVKKEECLMAERT